MLSLWGYLSHSACVKYYIKNIYNSMRIVLKLIPELIRFLHIKSNLTNCCVQICQPLFKLLLQIQFFFGVAFSKGRQQETDGHGGSSHTEQYSTSQLTNIQSPVETDSVAVRKKKKNSLFDLLSCATQSLLNYKISFLLYENTVGL